MNIILQMNYSYHHSLWQVLINSFINEGNIWTHLWLFQVACSFLHSNGAGENINWGARLRYLNVGNPPRGEGQHSPQTAFVVAPERKGGFEIYFVVKKQQLSGEHFFRTVNLAVPNPSGGMQKIKSFFDVSYKNSLHWKSTRNTFSISFNSAILNGMTFFWKCCV